MANMRAHTGFYSLGQSKVRMAPHASSKSIAKPIIGLDYLDVEHHQNVGSPERSAAHRPGHDWDNMCSYINFLAGKLIWG